MVGGEWLATGVDVGLPGLGSGPVPVMGHGGGDGNAINAGSACGGGGAGKAGGDGGVSDSAVDISGVVGQLRVELRRLRGFRALSNYQMQLVCLPSVGEGLRW